MTTLVISPEDLDNFRRLDQYLHHHLPEISRSYIKTLFTEGNITSSEKIELKRMPPAGTTIEIDVPPPRPTKAQAEDIPLEVLFEDEHLIVINKPVGMVTHPAPGNYEGTLVNAILHHCGESLSGVGGEQRPGIVHRLDKGTSGVMVVAKTQASHEGLSQLFAEHDIERVYHCITVAKHFPLSVKVESSIGRHPQNRLKQAARVKNGRHAITYFKKLETHGHFHLIECRLETGRTHQIRCTLVMFNEHQYYLTLSMEIHSKIL